MAYRKVVFITPNIYGEGGLARVANWICNELAKKENYQITVVSLTYSEEELIFPLAPNISVLTLPMKSPNIRKDFLKMAKELRKLFSASFEGTFIISDVGCAIPAWLGLRHCKKAKFISWAHTNFFNGSQYGFAGFGKRIAVKYFDHVVVLTKEDAGCYQSILQAKNIVQIYNPKDPSITRQEYSMDSKKIISCGYLDKIKGFDMLIEVAKKVFDEIDDWQWDIYGEGAERENLQKQIMDYGLEGKVNLMGYHNDLIKRYQNYAFFVFTSRNEGLGMVMVEAQAAGLPVISFGFQCGPRDLITDGENGYIIENWNLDQMAARIVDVIQDEALRQRLSDNSQMHHEELELSYVLKKWEEIL